MSDATSNIRPFQKPSDRRVAKFSGAQIGSDPGFNETLAGQASPACDVTLTKGERTRRYHHIRPGQNLSEWYCQVWFGTNQLRGDRVLGVEPAQRLLARYQREIRELLADGWTALS